MRRSGSRSAEREHFAFESLQRRLAAQNLSDCGSDMEEKYEEKRCSPESVAAVPTSALCRFFVLGKCRYGSRCTFSHSLPAQVSECAADESDGLSAAAALVDCPFFLRGNCKYGEHCRLRHNPAMLPGAASAATSRSTLKATRSAVSSHNVPTNTREDNQQDFTCGICFDDIVQSGKHFGLLSCDHCFCLDCLRVWRQSKDMELEVI
ncbi:Makorin-like protein, partial [Phytophthora palmivora]